MFVVRVYPVKEFKIILCFSSATSSQSSSIKFEPYAAPVNPASHYSFTTPSLTPTHTNVLSPPGEDSPMADPAVITKATLTAFWSSSIRIVT